jgi:hypothetical protein
MSDQPLTLAVLAEFHRQVILPDVRRVVNEVVQGSESRLRDEMRSLHDVLMGRLDMLAQRIKP